MSKNKKIVQVLYSGLGGHATVAFSLVNGFYEIGYKNYIVFYGIEPVNVDYINAIKHNPAIKDFFGIQKKTKLGVKEWWYFYNYIRKIKPDIILLHSDQLIIASFIFNLFNKIKIITIEHDSISLRTRKKWFVSNLNALLADKIIVLKDSYKNHIKKKLWFKKLIKKYKIIPNGIDVKKFKNKEKYFKNSEIIIFMASRINNLRDHITLIEAVKLIKDTKIKLRIAGDGDQLATLKKKYYTLNFIEFLGNIDENKLLDELQRADIYVHATLAENFSTAILQAMSCGLPIITSDIEGTKHMIINKKNGLLYKPKNPIDLYHKICTLIKNRSLAQTLGQNARKDVVKKYEINKVVKKYINQF